MAQNRKGFLAPGLLASITFGALWRRWFGGGLGKAGSITRFWKYLALILFVLWCYWFFALLVWTAYEPYWTSVWFCIFWALGHGTWFIYWDHTGFAEGRHPWIDKIVWFFLSVDESRTFWGNAFGMLVRYTLTAIPVAVSTSWWFLLAGPLVSLCYAVAGYKRDTRVGEILSGACIFSLLFLSIGGII